MKKFILASTLIALGISISPAVASADTGCDGIYGGGTNCGTNGFILKKQVADPTNTSNFVDNLDMNNPYKSGNLVYFRLTVTNNTNSDLTGVTLTDNLPRFITYQGDPKLYNSSTNSVTYNLGTLKKGQAVTDSVTGIITEAQNLPSDQQITCVVNQAQANASNGQGTQASSQFCIQKAQNPTPSTTPQQTTKGGLPVDNQNQTNNQSGQQNNQNNQGQTKGGLPTNQGTNQQNPSYPVYTPAKNAKQTPKSGPEALPLLAMIPTGAFGMWLRKISKS